jgi:hypothetical protein
MSCESVLRVAFNVANRLLEALSRQQYEGLLANFELVRLTPGRILYAVGDSVHHAYFPIGRMI